MIKTLFVSFFILVLITCSLGQDDHSSSLSEFSLDKVDIVNGDKVIINYDVLSIETDSLTLEVTSDATKFESLQDIILTIKLTDDNVAVPSDFDNYAITAEKDGVEVEILSKEGVTDEGGTFNGLKFKIDEEGEIAITVTYLPFAGVAQTVEIELSKTISKVTLDKSNVLLVPGAPSRIKVVATNNYGSAVNLYYAVFYFVDASDQMINRFSIGGTSAEIDTILVSLLDGDYDYGEIDAYVKVQLDGKSATSDKIVLDISSGVVDIFVEKVAGSGTVNDKTIVMVAEDTSAIMLVNIVRRNQYIQLPFESVEDIEELEDDGLILTPVTITFDGKYQLSIIAYDAEEGTKVEVNIKDIDDPYELTIFVAPEDQTASEIISVLGGDEDLVAGIKRTFIIELDNNVFDINRLSFTITPDINGLEISNKRISETDKSEVLFDVNPETKGEYTISISLDKGNSIEAIPIEVVPGSYDSCKGEYSGEGLYFTSIGEVAGFKIVFTDEHYNLINEIPDDTDLVLVIRKYDSTDSQIGGDIIVNEAERNGEGYIIFEYTLEDSLMDDEYYALLVSGVGGCTAFNNKLLISHSPGGLPKKIVGDVIITSYIKLVGEDDEPVNIDGKLIFDKDSKYDIEIENLFDRDETKPLFIVSDGGELNFGGTFNFILNDDQYDQLIDSKRVPRTVTIATFSNFESIKNDGGVKFSFESTGDPCHDAVIESGGGENVLNIVIKYDRKTTGSCSGDSDGDPDDNNSSDGSDGSDNSDNVNEDGGNSDDGSDGLKGRAITGTAIVCALAAFLAGL